MSVCGRIRMANSELVNFHHFASSHFSSRSCAFYFLLSRQSNINQTWRFFYHSQIFAVIKSRVLILTCFQTVTQTHFTFETLSLSSSSQRMCVYACRFDFRIKNRKSLHCIWADGYQNICDEKMIRSQFFLLFLDESGSVSEVQSFDASIISSYTSKKWKISYDFSFLCSLSFARHWSWNIWMGLLLCAIAIHFAVGAIPFCTV